MINPTPEYPVLLPTFVAKISDVFEALNFSNTAFLKATTDTSSNHSHFHSKKLVQPSLMSYMNVSKQHMNNNNSNNNMSGGRYFQQQQEAFEPKLTLSYRPNNTTTTRALRFNAELMKNAYASCDVQTDHVKKEDWLLNGEDYEDLLLQKHV